MIIDGKGKLFGKISIIDVIIVLIVLAAVAGVGYKFTKSKTVSPFVKPDDIQLTFMGDEIPEYMKKAIKVDSLVKDAVQAIIMGSVKEIKINKSVSIGQNDKGEYVQTSKPGYYSIYITVDGKGLIGDGKSGVTIGNTDYYIGQIMSLKVGNVYFNYNIKICDIKKRGNAP